MTWTKLPPVEDTWTKQEKEVDSEGTGFLTSAGGGFMVQPFLENTSSWTKLDKATDS